MPGFKTEGIILKRRDFGEADRILTAFTFHRGKVTIMAKGVRRITSRRAGNVELLNRVQMFLHPGKQFLILTEAVSLETYSKLKEDLTLSTYAYHIIELIDRLTVEDQGNPLLYTHLIEILQRLSRAPRQILIRAFEVKLLTISGFWSIDDVKDISPEARQLLTQLETLSWDEIEKIQVSEDTSIEAERILRLHIERVIEGSLKSRQFLKKN
jgi:recombinational DNA repair protein (RecF pathway)